MPSQQDLATLCINTIRTLSIDAVQAANSGHPGTPMALAPLGYVLWNHVLRFDPDDPIWPNRDRLKSKTASVQRCCGRRTAGPLKTPGQPSRDQNIGLFGSNALLNDFGFRFPNRDLH